MSGSTRLPEEGERRLTCSPAVMAAGASGAAGLCGSAELQLPRASCRELQASQPPAEQSSALFILLVNPQWGCAHVNLWLWLNKVTQVGAFLQGFLMTVCVSLNLAA